MNESKNFLLHLNGARALAIIAIFFYHLDESLSPCGYFGVDLFLVLSGFFLFRNDLLPKMQAGSFSYATYLLKKTWRITPPWYLTALFCCLLCACIMIPDRFALIAETFGACSLGISNETIARSGGYFSPNSQQNPLMHLWYVGLTIQLYILIPLIYWGALRFFGARFVRPVFAGFALLSLALYLLLTHREATVWTLQLSDALLPYFHPYYSFATRFWEVALALFVLQMPLWRHRFHLRAILASMGLVLFVAPIFLFETESSCVYPSLLGACLLICYGDSSWVGRVLSWRPLQFIGTISFSIYLCHWPVFAIGKYWALEEPSTQTYVIMSLIALALSILLFYCVERNCVSWSKNLSRKASVWLLTILFFISAFFGAAFAYCPYFQKFLPQSLSEELISFQHTGLIGRVDESQFPDFPGKEFPARVRVMGNDQEQPYRFLLMGDSHSWHLLDGLNHYCSELVGVRGLYLADSSLPIWNLYRDGIGGGPRWTREAAAQLLAWLASKQEIETVVLSVYWSLRYRTYHVKNWDFEPVADAQRHDFFEKGLTEMCRQLQAIGKNVVIIRGLPRFPGTLDPVDEYARCSILGYDVPQRTQSFEEYQQENAGVNALFDELEAQGLARCFDPAPILLENGQFSVQDKQGVFLFQDSNHLSREGSRRVAEAFLRWWKLNLGAQGE